MTEKRFRIPLVRNLFLYVIAYNILEFYGFRCRAKRRESGNGVAEIKHLSVVIVLIIHTPQIGVSIQHRLLSFDPVILYQFTGNANPCTLMECGNLYLGVSQDLLRAGLGLAGLDVKLAIKNIGGAKIRSGEATLEELAAHAEEMGAPELPGSGRQEYLESIVNQVMFG